MKIGAPLPPVPKVPEASREPSEIQKAARQFEGLLLNEVFRVMRRTVPNGGLFGGGISQDIFTGMLDEQLAREAAGGTGFGIAESIAQQLSPKLPVPPDTHRMLTDGEWVRPLTQRIPMLSEGQRFGAARAGERPDECGDGHCGIDVGAKEGTAVVSVSDGVVRKIGRDSDSEAGLFVEVAHRHGAISSRYLHLHEIPEDLEVGQSVRAGQMVGAVGDTGQSARGDHLHFELVSRERGRQFLDPEPYLKMWRSVDFPKVSDLFVDDSNDGKLPERSSVKTVLEGREPQEKQR